MITIIIPNCLFTSGKTWGVGEKPINQKMYKTYHLQQDLLDAQKVGLHSLLQNGAENEARWSLVSCQMEVGSANKPWLL